VRHHLFAIIDRSALAMPVTAVPPNTFFGDAFYPPGCQSTVSAGSARSFTIPIGFPPPASAPPIYSIPAGTQVTVQCNDSQTGNQITRPTNVLNPILPLQAGSIITVDVGANQETVVVKGIQLGTVLLNVPQPNTQWLAATIVADFKKTHNAGFKVYTTLPGNPGPMTSFDPDTNTALVPFYTILD
jgi:hypothetical protein